jgi:hypothetical protein
MKETRMSSRNGKMLILMAAISAMLVISGCGGAPVIPTSYNTYKTQDGSFTIQYPSDLEAEGGGKGGYSWAKFTSGGATIAVDTSAVSSIVNDIARSGGGMGGLVGLAPSEGADQSSANAVHNREKQDFEQENGVEEQRPMPLATGFGDSRRSEFTGTKTFGGARHGYRVTTMGLNHRVRVVCECSESDWNDLKPAFDKVIESLSRGTQ